MTVDQVSGGPGPGGGGNRQSGPGQAYDDGLRELLGTTARTRSSPLYSRFLGGDPLDVLPCFAGVQKACSEGTQAFQQKVLGRAPGMASDRERMWNAGCTAWIPHLNGHIESACAMKGGCAKPAANSTLLRVRIPSEKFQIFTLALDFECTPGAIL